MSKQCNITHEPIIIGFLSFAKYRRHQSLFRQEPTTTTPLLLQPYPAPFPLPTSLIASLTTVIPYLEAHTQHNRILCLSVCVCIY